MASASPQTVLVDDYKELLICIICFGTLTDPKSISCGHSFCKRCIGKWMGKHKAKGNDRYPCPVCNKQLKIPKNGADAYGTNITIKSMVEILENQLTKGHNQNVNCDICIQEGEAVPAMSRCVECAEHMCKPCNKAHRRMRATQSHTIYDLTGDAEKDARAALDNYVKRNIECPKHPNQPLRFFCKQDKAVICRDCSITEHPGHNCQAIEEAAKGEERNIAALLGLATQRKEIFDKFIQSAHDSIQSCERNTQALLRDIDADHAATKKQLDEHFDKLRNKAKAAANEKKKKIQANQDQFQLNKGITESTLLQLNHLRKYNHPVDVLNYSANVLKKLEEWSTLPEENVVPLDPYKYQPGILDTSNLGKQLKVPKYCDPKISKGVHLPDKNPGVGNILGLARGYNNNIVVSHGWDGLAIYTADFFTLQHKAQGRFWDAVCMCLCCIQSQYYAAADRNNNCIAVLDKKLEHQRNIGKFQDPIGLCETADGKLLVVDDGAKCVYLIDCNDGNVLATIGEGKLTDPRYVTINHKGIIFVSDLSEHCVKRFTMEGEEVPGAYGSRGVGIGQLNCPLGVCIDSQDNLIIADHNNHRVHMVDPNGTFIKYLLVAEDGMKPWSVAIDQQGDLIVGSYNSGDLTIIKYIE
ncbi:unnamed protein product [Owenia fusiformis]|uniref:Uncharacterized protein n=1 Tax=Owenia fusiformis TaxID=6347 RepID=A0A8J1UKT7_OWEFU|nr:unnamed protein product [Owenia fusiformis]